VGVDVFDTRPLQDPDRAFAEASTRGSEGLHSAQYVTVELRRRYKMSRRGRCGIDWHARCNSYQQKGGNHTALEGSKLADNEEDCGPREGITPPARGLSRLDNNNKRRHSSTKQASDQTPVPQQGFFFACSPPGRRRFPRQTLQSSHRGPRVRAHPAGARIRVVLRGYVPDGSFEVSASETF